MHRRLLPPFAAFLLLTSFAPGDDAIGFIEKFALAQDREAVLGQLIPGSEEYYFYHALHFQNTRQTQKLTALLQQWAKRFPQSRQKQIIENREALLSYDANPQATLKFLKQALNLEFNHEQQARDQKPDLPTALDPARIAREVFQGESLAVAENLSQFHRPALEALVRDKTPLTEAQVRVVLSKLERPDVPNLVDFIEASLRFKESRGFGEFDIHRRLLPEQLDELARRRPQLYAEQAFVYARLRQLAPGADAEAEYFCPEREAWLERVWAYVSKLPPAFNSLKASVLKQRLESGRARGVYDEALFLTYLKLPRRAGYVSGKYADAPEQQRGMVDLNADFKEALSFARPVGNDEELVRDYFLHLFARLDPKGSFDPETVLAPWLPYVRDTWLKPVFAEAMITAGLGNPEGWASLLTPTAFQQLKERVEIDFARTNPQFLSPAGDVNLQLVLKNAPRLIVKIYEINTLSYFLTTKQQLNTDLTLDGLVANRELTKDFSEEPAGRSPFLRTARTFSFPELKGKRGAWVIEFIGGGKSSRALVRKGQWRVLQRSGAAGDILTVLDEDAKPVPEAVVWLEGRKFMPDVKTGTITVPYTQQPGNKPLILADAAGTFATLAEFEHHAESYDLEAQFYVEREQLLAGRQATLAVHPRLLLNGEEVSLGLLSDVRLTLTSKSLDGISTTSEIKAPKLEHERDFTHVFTVPDRLAELTVTLTGKVENLSLGGEKKELQASESWPVNGLDKVDVTADGHLSRFGEAYVFELLGKNGESLPDRQVVFDFTHRDFANRVWIPLRTDERGRVALGALPGITALYARTPDDRARDWNLPDFDRTWPEAIHARAGDTVRVPVPPEGVRFSLLERRGETYVADRHAAGRMEGGYLLLEGLAAGDYSLVVSNGEPHAITLRVTAGQPVAGWLVAPNRALEVRQAAPLQIAAAQADAEALTVQLAQWDPFTRVHIAATRFLPEGNLFTLGQADYPVPAWSTPDRLPALYASARKIGDEYRYILERRYAKVFPGNLLTRPGLLLNPWETRSTELGVQHAEATQSASAMAGGRRGSVQKDARADRETADFKSPPVGAAAGDEGANLDFLAAAAPVAWNLTPDEHGVVRLPRAALGDRQYLQILAENRTGAVRRTLALAEAGTKFRDLRLPQSLDPALAFTRKKEATVLPAGGTLKLANVLTSELQTYDSLASVFALFTTLHGDSDLAAFGWLLDWPTLKEEEKRAKYSEFSCHELNLFLARKDPEFFRRVIAPYLASKKEKTFVDEYLLEQPLQRWLEPWAYEQLNVAERCLLARRLPGEAAATARHLRELRELVPPNPGQEDSFFDVALRGRGLEPLEGSSAAPAAHYFGLNAPEAALAPGAPAPAGVSAGDKAAPMSEAKSMAAGLDVTRFAMGKTAGLADGITGVEELGRESLALGVVAPERRKVRAFFRALGPAKEWAENQYYHVRLADRGPQLIGINDFWNDYAQWNGQAPFVSAHFAEASRNFSEMMLALALLDLPFTAPKHETKSEAGAFTLTAAGPLVAFHQEIEPAAPAKDNPELLVSQNFFALDDRFREQGNEKFEKYVGGEFITGRVYGANVVVTNPTSTPQKLQLLLQIPQGALPVGGSRATDSKRLQLAAYTTQTFEYHFYFPAPSEQPFRHYPVHVSREGTSAGAAKPATFKVVRQLSEVDQTSWAYISQYGSEADVLAWLKASNLQRLDLDQIAWRVRKSAPFFHQVLALLTAAHCYSTTLWSYSVYHGDADRLREFLRHQPEFLAQCGPALRSKLLEIDPTERREYEHLEYSPLVNQRSGRFTAENRIPNPVLLKQYQTLLQTLAHRPRLGADR